MAGRDAQAWTTVRSVEVLVEGTAVGVAVSLGTAHLFFTPRPDLLSLDGQRFTSLEAIDARVASLWSGALCEANRWPCQ